MAGQLLPLRILTSSKTLLSSRGSFSFRFKTLVFSPKSSFPTCSSTNSSARCFSARPSRSRDSGRSGFRAAVGGGEQGKSLIEDEAELSDWVSDLKTDSFRLAFSGSDSEDSDRDRKRSGKRNGRDDRAESTAFSDRGRSRGSVGSPERQFADRNFEGSRGSNGLRKTATSGRFSERKARASSSSSSSPRRFVSDLEEEDDEEEDDKEEFLSRQKIGRGSSSSFTKRGGRNAESSFKKGGKYHGDTSEDDEEDDDVYGLDDDFFGDKVDKHQVGMKDSLLKSIGAIESGYGGSGKPVSRSSDGDKDSYLSNTR